MNNDPRMSEAYDHEAEYDANIAPHVEAIWNECKRLNLPMLIAVCHSNTPTENGAATGQAIAVNLIGQERTPPTFIIAEKTLKDSPTEAFAWAAMSGTLSDYQQTVYPADEAPPINGALN